MDFTLVRLSFPLKMSIQKNEVIHKMDIQVSVEKSSPIKRKLTIKVPANIVSMRFEKGLQEVQRTANVKGFRPGMAPITMIKKFYGEDIRHNVFHRLIDETFEVAVKKEQLRAVGSPQIDTPDHKTGDGEHDHTLDETKDFTFIATVEILPEIEVKGYTGLSLKKLSETVEEKDIESTLKNIQDSQAQLNPVEEDGYKAKKGDFVDLEFDGGIKTDKGVEKREGMKGSRLLEIGSNQFIEGFEDEIVGLKSGETKTFTITFPKDYFEKTLAGNPAEFTIKVNGIKKKTLADLNDDLAKNAGFENLVDLKIKIREQLETEKKRESERKLRSDLLAELIEKNNFEVPQSLIQTQTRALAQEVATNLKNQGFNDQMIQEALSAELENLKKRAESQVRASLILEAVSKKEKIEVTNKDLDAEIETMAKNMNIDLERVKAFYSENARRREDLEYRLREDKTIQFIVGKSKVSIEK